MSDAEAVVEKRAKGSARPGHTAVFPDWVGRVAYAVFGVQAPSAEIAAPYTARLRELLRRPDGPGALERFHYRDPQGSHCDVFLAGWLRAEDHDAWFAAPEVAAWWRALPCTADSEIGVWREVMTPHKDYFQYGSPPVADVGGFSRLGEVVPSHTFGYWGAYRDRIPASVRDDLMTPLSEAPAPVTRATRGQRLSVVIPDNICFTREGQGWNRASAEERQVWDERMKHVADEWIAYLHDNPAKTGCLSLRYCRDQEVDTGEECEKQSQILFMLSLRHLETEARTAKTHLAVLDTFKRLYRGATFKPRMHIWVETFILKHDELTTEYVNCHPATGLLPYFEVRPAVASSR